MIILIGASWDKSGKSTLAQLLQEALEVEYKIYRAAFANPLKQLATSLGWNGKKDEEGRLFLRQLGEAVRKYNPPYWTLQELNRLSREGVKFHHDLIIFDDWRFRDPEEVICRHWARVFKVEVRNPLTEHLPKLDSTELGLEEASFDFCYRHGEPVDPLVQKIKEAL